MESGRKTDKERITEVLEFPLEAVVFFNQRFSLFLIKFNSIQIHSFYLRLVVHFLVVVYFFWLFATSCG